MRIACDMRAVCVCACGGRMRCVVVCASSRVLTCVTDARARARQVKWRLMVASCYRRMGAYQKAVELYERIHRDSPENLECACRLRARVRLSSSARLQACATWWPSARTWA